MRPQNILVRMPNWIGDLVMAMPVLTDLRRTFPQARITAMCKKSLCDLLKEEETIDELFCFEKPTNRFLRGDLKRNIIAKIQAGAFDTGILLTCSFSSAWWFWQGSVTRRIGYAGHFRRLLLTDVIPESKDPIHQVIWFKRLLLPLGVEISHTAPSLRVLDQEVDEAKELLYQRGYNSRRKLIGINPGAAYGSAKCWMPERFRELAQRLVQDGVLVVFFGDTSSQELVKGICQRLPQEVINLAGMTNLRELLCLIKSCDVLVTNDSGPMHIAAAFGVPVVALFGSTDEVATGPYGQEEGVIHKHVKCSPCFKRVCPIDFPCMKEISVEEVESKTKQLLKKPRV